MKIGIDIDDTTFITVKSMLKYGNIFNEELTGKKSHNDNFGLIKDRYYLKVLYGWDDATKFAFFDKYYKNILEDCILMPDADTVIQRLKSEGDSIHFVTARLMDIVGCDTKAITERTLAENHIPYDSLDLSIKDKVAFFKEHGIEICIEDSYETCREMTDNGIKAILMTSKMNESIPAGDIVRVSNWNEVYEEINKYREEKNSRK